MFVYVGTFLHLDMKKGKILKRKRYVSICNIDTYLCMKDKQTTPVAPDWHRTFDLVRIIREKAKIMKDDRYPLDSCGESDEKRDYVRLEMMVDSVFFS